MIEETIAPVATEVIATEQSTPTAVNFDGMKDSDFLNGTWSPPTDTTPDQDVVTTTTEDPNVEIPSEELLTITEAGEGDELSVETDIDIATRNQQIYD